jgi:hypothetical protein
MGDTPTDPLSEESILPPPSPESLRAKLEEMVVNDLLGPAGGPEEVIETRPRERYLVGMLAPHGVQTAPEEEERVEVEEGTDTQDGQSDDSVPAAPTLLPSSIGVSFCIGSDTPTLRVTARWGRYLREKPEEENTKDWVWRRTQVERSVRVDLGRDGKIAPVLLTADQPEVVVRGVVRRLGDDRVVTLFLVNGQEEPKTKAIQDEAWLFQPELVVEATDGSAIFHRRPSGNTNADSLEEAALAMRYRGRVELATGHGVAAHVVVDPADPRRGVRIATSVMPTYEVAMEAPPTDEEEPLLAGLVLDMKELAEAPVESLSGLLTPLPKAYADWIKRQERRVDDPDARLAGFEDVATAAVARCERALKRIEEGISLLENDEQAAAAFQFANRAMWHQRIHTLYAEGRRRGEEITLEQVDVPANRTWRTFQLAFLLLNLESTTRLDHPDRCDPSRAVADLLFFPTGGGKTEAYLGLAAYVMGLRRLQGEVAGRSGEHGVAVLMRYTLRLLTLQQFQRATALICACEMIRRDAEAAGEAVWGTEPFRIGLWVGMRSTPNRTEDAATALQRERGGGFGRGSIAVGVGSPVQLKHCPWCGTAIEPGRDMVVEPAASSVGRTFTWCGDNRGQCPFSKRISPTEGIPVVTVDEEIYRRLPTLLIATVDKFAQMPWNGRVQMLFGQVDRECPRHGFVSPEVEDSNHQARGTLPKTKLQRHAPLRPPDLIIQDELHLISGPLGSLTGLYETAVDRLCTWEVDGQRVRPKVVASTATIRRAEEQVHALFLRCLEVFPPQGLDAGDNFFSREQRLADKPGRLYLGICAPGRRLKVALIRAYVALLCAAQRLYNDYGRHADPWMTAVGYFNSIRELGGMRRLVDDDVRSRAGRGDIANRGLAPRTSHQVQELTSRLPSTEIPTTLDRLETAFDPEEEERRREALRAGERTGPWPIDVLLATNMISVGVDVKRLGLMVVTGQPKTTGEYIQATSRVGRSFPGLVCTLYNWARPRDLSHYETFEHYHATFYQHVEALSVTPFASRALDRGLSALLVSLVRLMDGRFNANPAAEAIDRDDPLVQAAIEGIVERVALVEERAEVADEVRRLLERRLDEWLAEVARVRGAGHLGYRERKDGQTVGLLKRAGGDPWSTFTCLNSLRDVEEAAALILEDAGPATNGGHGAGGPA